ncbi:MAG: response regulator transcription factor [Phaeodactylibacter sp.]|nr:response regulator transcription factor [Phaeodactylibacter sp.]
MLTAIALDDEIPALEIIEAFAAQTELVSLKACFFRTRDARRYLEENSVGLVFLDVNMPAMSGIEFARALPNDVIIIFTTSYTEYAVESYNLHAADYLLKPFTFERFVQALEKAKLLYQARRPAPEKQPIVLKANYGLANVWPEDILFIEALDNYLKIHLQGPQLLVVRLTLGEMLDKLPAGGFLRVHRSYIVPVDRVSFIRNKTIYIGEHEIPLGGKYEADFFRAFREKP